ncbi:MAG: hypothetical protein NTY01_15725 [Verrucomicrobia bacterium]|nr:hypothetical protein [Verrucomicrobiota bacterium]
MTNKLTVATVLAFCLAAIPAGAIPINITMIGNSSAIAAPASQLPNFGDAAVFNWLKADVAAFDAAFHASYPTPTALPSGAPLMKVETPSGGSAITFTLPGNDYAFLHWGGKNGGWEQAYYNASAAPINYTFSAPPGGNPKVGSLSFYSSYGSAGGGGGSVPEGGVTIGLLGMAIGGLVLLRKP